MEFSIPLNKIAIHDALTYEQRIVVRDVNFFSVNLLSKIFS